VHSPSSCFKCRDAFKRKQRERGERESEHRTHSTLPILTTLLREDVTSPISTPAVASSVWRQSSWLDSERRRYNPISTPAVVCNGIYSANRKEVDQPRDMPLDYTLWKSSGFGDRVHGKSLINRETCHWITHCGRVQGLVTEFMVRD
jgi:hypothetical protein